MCETVVHEVGLLTYYDYVFHCTAQLVELPAIPFTFIVRTDLVEVVGS